MRLSQVPGYTRLYLAVVGGGGGGKGAVAHPNCCPCTAKPTFSVNQWPKCPTRELLADLFHLLLTSHHSS